MRWIAAWTATALVLCTVISCTGLEMYMGNFANMAGPYERVLTTQRNLFQLEEAYNTTLMTAWRRAVEIQGLLSGEE